MKVATHARWAVEEEGIRKQRPAASRVQAICGNVKRRRARRPKVSIVQTAGNAKRTVEWVRYCRNSSSVKLTVDQTETEGCPERGTIATTGLFEYSGGVECDDVDLIQLLVAW